MIHPFSFSRSFLLAAAIASLFFAGCSCTDPSKQGKHSSKESETLEKDEIAYVDIKTKHAPINQAVAEVRPIKDSKVKGLVTFYRVDGGIQVLADIEGLTPGEHGFHIHEFGDCGGEGGAATGGHFNPTKKKHGSPDDEERHVGDLGNLVADLNGKAHYDRIDKQLSFDGEHSILGRSIVVHADRDDFVTQPSGNSGAKIGCGLIEGIETH